MRAYIYIAVALAVLGGAIWLYQHGKTVNGLETVAVESEKKDEVSDAKEAIRSVPADVGVTARRVLDGSF